MGAPDHFVLKLVQSSMAWQRALAILLYITACPVKLVLMERGCTDFTQFFHYISKPNSESITLPKLCMSPVAQSISF